MLKILTTLTMVCLSIPLLILLATHRRFDKIDKLDKKRKQLTYTLKISTEHNSYAQVSEIDYARERLESIYTNNTNA